MKQFAAVSLLLFFTACGGGRSVSINGAFQYLTTGNLGGEDDDPCVAVDPKGKLHVVWFSNRDGTKDLYHVKAESFHFSTGTITWSTPQQITFNSTGIEDNYPSLFIDASGTFHLAWHRVDGTESHIRYLRSDGTAEGWAAATVVNITTGATYDRFPNVTQYGPNDLRIYFTHHDVTPKDDIYMVKSTDNGATFSAPTVVNSLNDIAEETAFPTVLKISDTSYIATIQRYASGEFLDPTSDIYFAESLDGENWSVSAVTTDAGDDKVDFVPTLFLDHTRQAFISWSTNALGDTNGDIARISLSAVTDYPSAASLVSSNTTIVDHSSEIVPLTVDGQKLYVDVRVQQVDPPHNQVRYRVFSSF